MAAEISRECANFRIHEQLGYAEADSQVGVKMLECKLETTLNGHLQIGSYSIFSDLVIISLEQFSWWNMGIPL